MPIISGNALQQFDQPEVIIYQLQPSDSIAISLDYQTWRRKPSGPETAIITNRIADQQVSLDIRDIAERLVQLYGQTLCPATFRCSPRNNANWQQQQLFLTDIDHDLTLQQAFSRCERFGVQPCFAYSSFSAIDDERYRMGFRLPYPIEDVRLRNIVAQALLVLFSECDKKCADPSRLFHGGKRLLVEDYDQALDIPGLIEAMCEFLFVADPQHAARKLRSFSDTTGVMLDNGLPAIEIIDSGDITTTLVKYITGLEEKSPHQRPSNPPGLSNFTFSEDTCN